MAHCHCLHHYSCTNLDDSPSTLASQFLGVLSSSDLSSTVSQVSIPMITHRLVFQPFSCHGTHKITFTDHAACGQMQLTSQRERDLLNPGPARNSKGSEDQFPVTPVFIHEITRHLRSLYYRWILYVVHKPNFKKSTLWLPYLIFPTILWLHQDVPTRSWSTIIFSLSFTSLTSSVFVSNLESMIYHHNHYFNFLAPLSLWQNPNSN